MSVCVWSYYNKGAPICGYLLFVPLDTCVLSVRHTQAHNAPANSAASRMALMHQRSAAKATSNSRGSAILNFYFFFFFF